MRSFGPTWALAFTFDRDLLLFILISNLAFAVAFVLIQLRGRGWLERGLSVLGLFTLLNTLSLVGLYLLSGTPVRSVDFFSLF
ncbi:hypothetical protein KKF91_11480 [Myxococcota bacterium]|nr:hypothetical protein [Myxococcota bacterium]MBU1431149.1 hypothetical protein [Myxococcota bacterium]MBU1897617.1 hypothetical protein [Myxococcota bacterium]